MRPSCLMRSGVENKYFIYYYMNRIICHGLGMFSKLGHEIVKRFSALEAAFIMVLNPLDYLDSALANMFVP